MKKFTFRMQVVLDMRQKELEERQMEMAKIVDALNKQKEKLQGILEHQMSNNKELDALFQVGDIDISQIECHRAFGIKLVNDAKNQERIINNTQILLERKQKDVLEAHQKVEVLKKIKEKQEKEYYKEFLQNEIKEIDDLTSSRFRIG